MNYQDRDVIPLHLANRTRVFELEEFVEIEIPPAAECIVDGILPAHGFAVIYGEPGCGKSFFASYMGLHVALGRPFGGKAVQPGPVVYVAAEGVNGLRKRIVAFREHEGIADVVPFYLVPEAPDLGRRAGDARLLIDCIKHTEPALVVIDTLARTMCGGDENSAADMGTFIANCDMIARELDCMVAVIHHSGKDGSRGARGSNALKGAADVEIRVAGDEFRRTATVTKSKDDESGLELSFRLDRIEFDAHGREVSSCIVEILEDWARANKTASKPKVTGSAEIALRMLEEAAAEAGEKPPASNHIPPNVTVVTLDIWRRYSYLGGVTDSKEPSAQRQAFNRARKTLISKGLIGQWGDYVWLAN